MGNLSDVKNLLFCLEITFEIIDNPAELEKVGDNILPGFGAYGTVMTNLNKIVFSKAISELKIYRTKPILGI